MVDVRVDWGKRHLGSVVDVRVDWKRHLASVTDVRDGWVG